MKMDSTLHSKNEEFPLKCSWYDLCAEGCVSPLDSLKSLKSAGGLCPGQETTLATRDGLRLQSKMYPRVFYDEPRKKTGQCWDGGAQCSLGKLGFDATSLFPPPSENKAK